MPKDPPAVYRVSVNNTFTEEDGWILGGKELFQQPLEEYILDLTGQKNIEELRTDFNIRKEITKCHWISKHTISSYLG